MLSCRLLVILICSWEDASTVFTFSTILTGSPLESQWFLNERIEEYPMLIKSQKIFVKFKPYKCWREQFYANYFNRKDFRCSLNVIVQRSTDNIFHRITHVLLQLWINFAPITNIHQTTDSSTFFFFTANSKSLCKIFWFWSFIWRTFTQNCKPFS